MYSSVLIQRKIINVVDEFFRCLFSSTFFIIFRGGVDPSIFDGRAAGGRRTFVSFNFSLILICCALETIDLKNAVKNGVAIF